MLFNLDGNITAYIITNKLKIEQNNHNSLKWCLKHPSKGKHVIAEKENLIENNSRATFQISKIEIPKLKLEKTQYVLPHNARTEVGERFKN